jgi:iron-sulfur cluster assembly accessory protein
MMFSITESAQEMVKSTLAEKQIEGAVRVFLADSGGCSGTQLALTVDDAKDDDQVFEVEGQTFLVDQNLSELCGELKVDFVDDGIRKGFLIASERPFAQHSGCGSCGCC